MMPRQLPRRSGFFHGYNVEERLDKKATRFGILNALTELVSGTSADDHVIIFFAGHGTYDKELDRGYWVPSDATDDDSLLISNSDIIDRVKAMDKKKAGSVLIIADSCFSGSLMEMTRGVRLAQDESSPFRRILASGGLQKVSDSGRDQHSIFSSYLLESLTDPSKKEIDVEHMAEQITRKVASRSAQKPVFGLIHEAGDENGKLVLRKTDPSKPSIPIQPLPAPKPGAAPSLSPTPTQNHLDPIAMLTKTSKDDIVPQTPIYPRMKNKIEQDALEKQKTMVNNTGMPLEVRTKTVNICLRFIPPGEFQMGSPPGEGGRSPRENQKTVKMLPFYIGKYEVTQEEWMAVMQDNPSEFSSKGKQFPVENITWEDCQSFLRKLCEKEGVSLGTYRLPTEAEWEYACRAGTTTRFYAGDDELELRNSGWFVENTIDSPEKTGSLLKRPNAWGLFDMLGNVMEWCADSYSNSPDEVAKVVRGGAWNKPADDCRAAKTISLPPKTKRNNLGFRVLRQFPDQSL